VRAIASQVVMAIIDEFLHEHLSKFGIIGSPQQF